MLDAAREQVQQAKSNFYPSIGVEALANHERDRQFGTPLDRDTRSVDGFVRWNLFRGLSDYHTVRMAKHDKQAATEDLAAAHEKVALQVTAAYLEVLRLRERLELTSAYVTQNKRLADDVGKMIEVGKSPSADADQVNVGLIEAEWQVAQLRGQLAGAEKTYELLAGHVPPELADPSMERAMADAHRDQMMEEVLLESPRVLASQARAAARTEEVGVAGGALLPQVTLEFRERIKSDITPRSRGRGAQ